MKNSEKSWKVMGFSKLKRVRTLVFFFSFNMSLFCFLQYVPFLPLLWTISMTALGRYNLCRKWSSVATPHVFLFLFCQFLHFLLSLVSRPFCFLSDRREVGASLNRTGRFVRDVGRSQNRTRPGIRLTRIFERRQTD